MRTTITRKEDVKHNWYLIDARDKNLGRLASRIAIILMGKNKVNYQPDLDNGDGVVVINAGEVKVTGNKLSSKVYYSHSGYMGNLKEITLKELLEKNPSKVLLLAVKRMLPKNKLARKMLTRLKIYKNANHRQKAQKPIEIKL